MYEICFPGIILSNLAHPLHHRRRMLFSRGRPLTSNRILNELGAGSGIQSFLDNSSSAESPNAGWLVPQTAAVFWTQTNSRSLSLNQRMFHSLWNSGARGRGQTDMLAMLIIRMESITLSQCKGPLVSEYRPSSVDHYRAFQVCIVSIRCLFWGL